MLLGASSQLTDTPVNLKAITSGGNERSGVPAEAVLLAFTDAVVTDSAELASARAALFAELGSLALVDAAGVIGNFERMTRIADGTGIPLDARMADATEEIRAALGINGFGSADITLAERATEP